MDLTALQQSALLQSLGWAIANSLWQAAALWIIYQLVNASYRSSTARFRNNSSTLLLFSVFGWFLITFISKFIELNNSAVFLAGETNEYAYTVSGSINMDAFMAGLVRTLPYLSVAYLLLVVLLVIRLVHSYLHIYFIKNHGLKKPPVEWRLFTSKVALHIGLTKKISLWFSTHVDVPATIGFLKPMILIPVASINQLTGEQLEAIILHELSHIRRNDYLINLFISIVETVMFFNPFVVLLSKIIKRERENCCDDFVIQYQYDRHAYASALLSLEQFRSQPFRLAMAATSGKKQLLGRVKRIMEASSLNSNFNYGQKLIALFLITGLMCSIAWLTPGKKENKSIVEKGNVSKSIITKTSNLKVKNNSFAEIKLKDANSAINKIQKELVKSPVLVKALNKALSSSGDILKYYMDKEKKLQDDYITYEKDIPVIPLRAVQQEVTKIQNTERIKQNLLSDLKRTKGSLAELQLKGVQAELKKAIEGGQIRLNLTAPDLNQIYTTIGKHLIPENLAETQQNVMRVMKILRDKDIEINRHFIMKDSLFPKTVALFQHRENYEKIPDDMKFTYNYTTTDVQPSVPPTPVFRARTKVETKAKTNCAVTITSNNGSNCPDGWVFFNNNGNPNSQPIAVAKGKTLKLIVSNGKELMEIRIEN